jgi:DNA repair exonuclease SbcCD ATPase subunit
MESRPAIDPAVAPKREVNPALIGMLFMLVMVTAAAGFFGWRSVNVERENQRLHEEVDGLMGELETRDQQAKQAKNQLASAHQEVEHLQSELNKVQTQAAEREKEWQRRDAEHRQRLQRSFEALASVVNDSGSALDYLKEMETKVRKGQTLGKEEVDELKLIGSGLALLQAQYERPLEEFKNLEESIGKELGSAPASAPADERKLFLRSLFDWKYREKQKAEKEALLKEQGRREALVDTQQELAQRYTKAQQEMAGVKKQFTQHMQRLDAVVGSQSANAAEMASFFEVSSEVIKIHQRAMNVHVEPVTSSPMPVIPGSDAIKP